MKNILAIVIILFTVQTVFCQENLDKNRALDIKKNPEYLYAEHQDKNTAFNMLADKVRHYENSEMRLDTTLLLLHQKSQSFFYKKNSHSDVTICFVLIKDLAVGDNPLVDDNTISDNLSIIEDVLGFVNYSDLNAYLEKRKREKHDIQFKLIRGDDGTRNCYWIVFNAQRHIIAILDKNFSTDLLTNQSVDYTKYINYPKIWLQIF